MILGSVVSSLISLFLLLFVGFALRKRGLIDARVTKGLSAIQVNVGMPAILLFSLQQTFSLERLHSLGAVAGGILVMTLCGLLPCLVVCLVKKVPLSSWGAWLNAASMSNAIFMARPIVKALYGDAGDFPLAGVMFAFNLLTFSLGVFLMNLGKKKGGIGRLILSSLCNPTVAIAALGFVLFVFSVQLPSPVLLCLEMLTGITSPLAMIIIGSLLAEISFRQLFVDARVYVISFIRLLVAPLLTFVILHPLIADPLLMGIVMLAAAMPTATTVAVFAEQYDNEPLLCSKTVFLSTLLSLFTIPVMVSLLL